MLKLIFKRLLWAFFLMIFASFLCFVMIYHAKGSVVFASVPQGVSLKVKEEIERNLNLDKPLLKQYENWLFNALKGEFPTH